MRSSCALPLMVVVAAAVACGTGRDEAAGSASGSEAAAAATTATAAESQPEPIALARSSLRAVATAQEAYWEDHGTYTTDLAVLKEVMEGLESCQIQEGVTVRIAEASENGWAMEATHPDYPGRSCVQWYGRPGAVGPIATAREGVRGDESPGRVVCDTP
jgi:hypothetical protein